ncbi:MAG: NADH-quinone oxidoreductase subunit NuoG [Deltaproteobacteria bacterium]|nr:NADH-quinone oxidoreductase subunit NuoG [Deltaproteobacteria bacterium]
MATVKINGKEITVEDGTLILDAARQAGFEIPTFCYQARLSKQGSCRMCLVEIAGQKKLQPSCVTPVLHGMEVFTENDTVKSARSFMLEFLLANHPLDCPTCDKGGECELQDFVFKFGPRRSAFSENKRRFHDKDEILSPVIVKNHNRCIHCERCVRMCGEVVGAKALGGIGRGAKLQETSFWNTTLDCDHCGNCIEVCPVGSFMSLPYRYKARPWDLKEVDTVCPYCATGCQFTLGVRNGEVVRVRSKVTIGVNKETLCARGRFGYNFIQSKKRLTSPFIKKDGKLVECSWDEAVSTIKQKFGSGKKTAGIASSRYTNEELFVFQKLMRNVFKTNNIDLDSRFANKWATSAMIDVLSLAEGGVSISDALKADVIFVLGSAISNENPITDYMIRGAASDRRKTLILAHPRRLKLDSSASISLRYKPGTEEEIIKGITASIEKGGSQGVLSLAGEKIKNAANVTMFLGADILRLANGADVAASIRELKETLKKAGKNINCLPLFDRCNQRGARAMGVHPLFLPGIKRVKEDGMDCGEILNVAKNGEIESLYVLGEDIVSMFPDADFVKEALSKIKFLVVQDVFLTETAKLADVVLPGTTYAEKDGTLTNQEGRVQRVRKAVQCIGGSKDDLKILCSIGGFEYRTARDVFDDIKKEVAGYRHIDFNTLDGNGALVKGHGLEDKGQGARGKGQEDRVRGLPPQALSGGQESGVRSQRQETSGHSEFPFQLITGNHLFHSGRVSQYDDILLKLLSEPFVEISEEDAREMGLSDKERVSVKSKGYEAVLNLRVVKGSQKGVAFIPENFDAVSVNHFYKRGEDIARVKIIKAGERQ